MSDPEIISVVSDLRAEESGSLLLHAARSGAFVSVAEAAGALVVLDMAREQHEHIRWLDELLDALDATPGPRRVRSAAAGLHYSHLGALIPQLIRDVDHLIAEYEAASRQVAREPKAADTVSRILARHRRHREQFEKLLRVHA